MSAAADQHQRMMVAREGERDLGIHGTDRRERRIFRAQLVMTARPLIAVVDDDESVRESLPDLLGELGFAVETYASAEDFLSSASMKRTGCLVLDIAMPGMSGLALQRELALRRARVPIIFITADANPALRERTLALGAVDCLFKPFSERALIDALARAFESAGG